jgi:hypothetical protein
MDNRAALRDFAAVQSVELNTAGSFSVLGLLVKKVAEKFDDVPAGGVGSLGIIGDRDATFDTGVVDSGGLTRIAISDHALRFFLEAAFAAGRRLRDLYRARDSPGCRTHDWRRDIQ